MQAIGEILGVKYHRPAPDRINRLLTDNDLQRLKEMHFALSVHGYELTNELEHLGCYLDKGGNAVCAVPIQGSDKRIVVKPEFTLETKLGDSGKEFIVDENHPEYNSKTASKKRIKQSIDKRYFRRRKRFIEENAKPIKREKILEEELKIRTNDIQDHRWFLYQEMHQPGKKLYGKLSEYGDDISGVYLTIAVAHWVKEQGRIFYERAAEHYKDIGIGFKWNANMERAVVLETINGDIKHYPILCRQALINEAFPAQIPMMQDLYDAKEENLIDSASMAYRKEQDRFEKEGIKSSTGMLVLDENTQKKLRKG